MKIYLAGPMRGLPECNFPAFDAARHAWEQAGHVVYCPAQIVRSMPYGNGKRGPEGVGGMPDDPNPLTSTILRHAAYSDIGCILFADGLALLPGWENSVGATMEVSVAQFLGLPLFCAHTMQEIRPPAKPWGFLRDLLPTGGREVNVQ